MFTSCSITRVLGLTIRHEGRNGHHAIWFVLVNQFNCFQHCRRSCVAFHFCRCIYYVPFHLCAIFTLIFVFRTGWDVCGMPIRIRMSVFVFNLSNFSSCLASFTRVGMKVMWWAPNLYLYEPCNSLPPATLNGVGNFSISVRSTFYDAGLLNYAATVIAISRENGIILLLGSS